MVGAAVGLPLTGASSRLPARAAVRAGVAQSVEQLPCKQKVGGSIPSASTSVQRNFFIEVCLTIDAAGH